MGGGEKSSFPIVTMSENYQHSEELKKSQSKAPVLPERAQCSAGGEWSWEGIWGVEWQEQSWGKELMLNRNLTKMGM